MCPKTNKLFCFICLVMGGNRSAWTQETLWLLETSSFADLQERYNRGLARDLFVYGLLQPRKLREVQPVFFDNVALSKV
ncbi:hypothetical protein NQ318_019152 [Aromia moschata]|uniref:Uncharacterized protein n=1 Tax=Aromia moschata TaxID=1265417 RepID=A0AAV8YR82_9CUCU|nr:hypothetical protein NQ318_019152 [Aromia moschata]